MQAHYQGVIHLSAGDLLRAEVDGGTAVGTQCAILMKEGKLVPMSVSGGRGRGGADEGRGEGGSAVWAVTMGIWLAPR